MIDLGVHGRRGDASVTKDLPDVGERGPGAQHLGRHRVSKTVRRYIGDACPRACAIKNAADRTGFGEPTEGSVMTEEDSSTVAGGPTSLQVGGERFADICRQWQAIVAASLAVHFDLTGAPVDVVELEHHDLSAAKA